jgi:hypothetical protein
MLWCIIYRIEQDGVLDMCQWSTLWKGFIKYNKFNAIIPWKPMLNLCIQNWLLVESWPLLKNLLIQVIINSLEKNDLTLERMISTSRYAITAHFGATNFYKKFNETHHFLEDLVLYICKKVHAHFHL